MRITNLFRFDLLVWGRNMLIHDINQKFFDRNINFCYWSLIAIHRKQKLPNIYSHFGLDNNEFLSKHMIMQILGWEQGKSRTWEIRMWKVKVLNRFIPYNSFSFTSDIWETEFLFTGGRGRKTHFNVGSIELLRRRIVTL